MQPTEQDIERDTEKDRFTKVLAALGLIAVLFGGSYLVVRYSPTVIRGIVAAAVSLSSKFTPGGGDAKLDLASDKYTIASGEALTQYLIHARKACDSKPCRALRTKSFSATRSSNS